LFGDCLGFGCDWFFFLLCVVLGFRVLLLGCVLGFVWGGFWLWECFVDLGMFFFGFWMFVVWGCLRWGWLVCVVVWVWRFGWLFVFFEGFLGVVGFGC